MFRTRIITRFTALFVVAFICLNAGGAACVAYCQTFDLAAEKEHCPLKKDSEHCNKTQNQNSDLRSIGTSTGEIDCCPFTVSFVSAPIEQSNISPTTAAATSVQQFSFKPVFLVGQNKSIIGVSYRGPPRDHRIDRIKNRNFRI